ncbi:MAG: GNAT family N-acetyltransferase [bacterium]
MPIAGWSTGRAGRGGRDPPLRRRRRAAVRAPRRAGLRGAGPEPDRQDEAAQLPVPLLQQLVTRHPDARYIAFATTVHGYEGTGRGFVLFLDWAAQGPRPLTVHRLHAPIRWDADDPLEARIFEALLLDAEPCPAPEPFDLDELSACRLDRDALAADETLLRDFFGLLVQAHYRTTPGDLHRLLDAPNVDLHALLLRGRVIAATLVAHEGGLPPALCARIHGGEHRLRGHALAEVLVCHAGRVEAGPLTMVRSVRIATHPALRRLGLGQRLVDHVHASYTPDLFGTLFGATPDLLAFRRHAGYRLVRLGASRGSRTGEPAAVMVRPVTPAAIALIERVQADFARDLPLHLALMRGDVVVDAAFADALAEGLPPPSRLDAAEADAMLASYAFGPRTLEAAAPAGAGFLARRPDLLAGLAPAERALVEARVLAHRGWDAAARAGGLPSIPAAMRAMRRIIRRLVEQAGGPFHGAPPVV